MSRAKLSVCTLALALGLLAPAGAAHAANYVVDSVAHAPDGGLNGSCDTDVAGSDDTPCTLLAAIEEANNDVAPDNITFAPGLGAITPTSASGYLVTKPVTIDGNGSEGAGATVIDGNDAVQQLFIVVSGAATTTLKDLRIEDGVAPAGGGGGALSMSDSTSLTNVVATSHGGTTGPSPVTGGAILNSGATLTLTDSQVTNNAITTTATFAANGAGISSAGPLVLTNSTVTGNTITGAGTSHQGGGIFVSGQFSVTRSTIASNTVSGGTTQNQGAGIFNGSNGGPQSIVNSTIASNTAAGTAPGSGGAQIGATTTITNATFAGNTGGAGGGATSGSDLTAYGNPTSVLVRNTIFGSAGGACGELAPGTIDSAIPGNNIDVGTSCGFMHMVDGNKTNTDPMLDPLALNAPGTTMTRALQFGSPAIDAAEASCGLGLGSDQRGLARPQPTGGVCDIGAYERIYRTLDAAVAGAGAGTIIATGLSCPGDCTHTLVDGSTLILTATPAAGSDLSSWSACDSTAGEQCTVNLSGSNRFVTANFALEPAAPPPGGNPPAKKKCKKGQKRVKGKCKKKKTKGK